jgi:hypothetical protein
MKSASGRGPGPAGAGIMLEQLEKNMSKKASGFLARFLYFPFFVQVSSEMPRLARDRDSGLVTLEQGISRSR